MSFSLADQYFIGRLHQIELLKRRCLALKDGYRQNIALLGPRFIGKTVLWHQLTQVLDDEKITFVYLDCEGRSLEELTTAMIRSLCWRLVSKKQIAVDDDTRLMHEAGLLMPQTVTLMQGVSNLIKENKQREAFHALLTLPEMFSQETGQKVVLMLDEFQRLDDLGVEEVFTDLGKRLMTQVNTLTLVASSQTAIAKEILATKLALLFGNFEIIDLSYLSFDEALRLLDLCLGDVVMGRGLKNFVVDLTSGHPLYIQLIAREMVAIAAVNKQQEIYAPLVAQALEEVIFNPWGVIARHFELQIASLAKGKFYTHLLQLMIAMSSGVHKLADLADRLQLKPTVVSQRLNVLVDAHLVARNGNYFQLSDRLMAYWIKLVYTPRRQMINSDYRYTRKLFKEEITRVVNEFMVNTRKDLTLRLSELMQKFDNDHFQLCQKRYHLQRLTNTRWRRLQLTHTLTLEAIDAQTSDEQESWLFIMKKDKIVEHDITLIHEHLKVVPQKYAKVIVVALHGLDDEARVRALAHKMWVWDTTDINNLMRLFDEPLLVA